MDWQYEQQPLRKRTFILSYLLRHPSLTPPPPCLPLPPPSSSSPGPHYDPSLESSAFLSRPHHQPLFSPSAGHQPLAGNSPAFLFHTPDHPRPPPLSPNNGGSFTFDPTAFNPVTAFGIPEVEMDLGGGPHPSNSSTDNAARAEDTLDGQPDEGGAADASLVQGVQSAAATARKLAGGAVKRVLRQRQSASSRRGGSRAYVEDDDDHDASEGDSADSASVRKPQPSLSALLPCTEPSLSRMALPLVHRTRTTTTDVADLRRASPTKGPRRRSPAGRQAGATSINLRKRTTTCTCPVSTKKSLMATSPTSFSGEYLSPRELVNW